MPIKLIGTEPYQVPRNSDLGTMAYQDATAISVGSITATGSTVNLITAYSYDNSATVTAQTTTSAGNVASLVLKSPVGNYGFYVADNSNALVLQDYLAGVQRLRVNSTGQMFLGSTTASTNVQFRIGKTITGSASSNGLYYEGQVASDVTSTAVTIGTQISTAGALTSLYHYNASQATLGGTVANQYGYVAQNSIRDATTNFHFYSENSAAVTTGKTVYGFWSGNAIATGGGTTWGFYANGDAPNYFSGAVGIGTAAPSGVKLYVGAAITSGTVTSTPTLTAFDSTIGNNALGKNFKLKLYTNTSSANDVGFGISSALLEIVTASVGDIAFFKNATTTPVELGRWKNDGTLVVGNAVAGNNSYINIRQGDAGSTGLIRWMFNTDSTVYGSLGIVYNNRATDGLLLSSVYPITTSSIGDTIFKTAPSGSTLVRSRITGAGKFLVGTHTNSRNVDSTVNTPIFSIESTGDDSILSIIRNDTTVFGSGIYIGKSKSASVGGVTAVALHDRLGAIGFVGADGTDINNLGAYIAVDVDNTVATAKVPGRMVFATTNSAGSTATRFMISSEGNAQFEEDVYIKGNVTQDAKAVSALAIDCSTGNFFTKTINADSTFTFTNVPVTGKAYAFTIEVIHTSGTITWPTSVKWNNDRAPALTTGKTHLFTFVTYNGGTRWRASALVDYVN